jgi:hypothetical protein
MGKLIVQPLHRLGVYVQAFALSRMSRKEKTISKKRAQTSMSTSFLFSISIFAIAFGVYQQIRQLTARADIGVGLTDEAFGILHAFDRALNGQTSQTPLFADLTSIMLQVGNYDIRLFRLFGFFLLVSVSILICWKITQDVKGIYPKPQIVWVCLTITFVVLLIPSSFRYLLVTPSYQWLILVASILIVSVLAGIRYHTGQRIPKYALPSAALLVCIIELSRLSSGFATWSLVCFFLAKKADLRSLLKFNLYVLCLNICYVLLNLNSSLESFARLNQIRKIDPTGSNLLIEIWDVTKAGTIALLLINLSIRLANSILVRHRFINNSKVDHKVFLQILALLILLMNFSYKDLSHLLAFVCIILIGLLIGAVSRNQDDALFVLALAPIVSQFGSGTSASYLIVPLVAFGFLCFFFSLGRSSKTELSNYDFNHFLVSLISLAISIILLVLQLILSTTSYENGFGGKAMVKEPVHGLRYSPEKLANIMQLRTEIRASYPVEGLRILDLSYWHPGVIFYVDGLQFPVATFDRYYSQSIFQQVADTVNQKGLQKQLTNVPIIVESNSKSPKLECLDLSNQIIDSQLRQALIENRFNPKVMEVAIYRSVKEDVTLYPRNVSILVPCDLVAK